MGPAKPSLELLRALTDEHVLRALMRAGRLTRAELAAATGISKPTAGESVRRLVAAGLVADTGQRTPGGRGRGRVGSYYSLAEDAGLALAVSIAPEGIIAECISPYGEVISRAQEPITRPARPDQVAAALGAAASQAVAGSGALIPAPAAPVTPEAPTALSASAVRLAVVSAADPVDRASGRMVHLPDSPFLLGDLDPVDVLAPLVAGPVTVDNDVNWAARAERAAAAGGDAARDDFAYLYLGEGLGCAVVSDGEVRRGHHGLAGEIAHVLTVGPGGRATRLIEVFGELGLRQPGTTAIDTPRLLAAVTGTPATRDTVARAVAGAIAAVVALADPGQIVLGGPWGRHPVVAEAIAGSVANLPRPVPVRPASPGPEPALAGAREAALTRLRAAIVSRAGSTPPN
jgi:predicted NBD/HSP70 family sugar kinase